MVAHDDGPKRPPALGAAADLLAIALLIAGTFILIKGGLIFRIGAVHLSMRTAWRPYLWGVIVVTIRSWAMRQPPSVTGLFNLFASLGRASATRLVKDATDPLPLDERELFAARASWPRRVGRLAWLMLGFSSLVTALTWPQIRRLDAVADLGDPLFSIWRIAWVNHQILRDPLHLFDANIFYPERLTLTYSDPALVPALMSAPLFWIGVHQIVIYNLLLLSGFVLSGVTMFLLVRALTGRVDAATIAGAIFAVYPYRFEHYGHLELQMTMWMPLALWGLHRALARGRRRDGLATGLAFALQTLSSLYYGCFLAIYIVVLGGALWLARGCPRRPLGPLAAGAALAALLIAPVATAYVASRPTIGDRDEGTVQLYSAEGPDYLKPTFRNLLYGRWSWSEGGRAERQLLPPLTPIVLTAVALWPPLSAARIAYTLSLILAVDGSFGLNGPTFTVLRAVVPPFKVLRAPSRFSILAGMTLAILAGYGAARLLERRPRRRVALTAGMLALVMIEARPELQLEPVWREPPAIYARIAGAHPVVLAEFPMPRDEFTSFEPQYLYFSTFHWQKLVNGYSGFFPPSYTQLLEHELDFPSEAGLNYLRSRGVEYLTMHGRFTNAVRYRNTIAWLDARSDLELVAAAPWEESESRLYRFRP
jgi:hypothetical protein